jgi:hypothetical protein
MWLSLIVLPVAGLVGFALLWKPGDPYAFLAGRRPLLTTVEGEMGGGGGGYDVHVYRWRENYSSVHAKMAKELSKLGFTENRPRDAKGKIARIASRLTFWTKGHDTELSLAAGRAATYKEAMALPGTVDTHTAWVTLTVKRYLEDGPYVWIRKALPHQSDF